MSWTDERVEMLKTLWAEGLSASQIAAQLGGVSRNAVIGKVHRLKLSSRGRAASSQPRQKKVARSGGAGRSAGRGGSSGRTVTAVIGATALQQHYIADAVAEQETRPSEDVVVPISRKLSLIELNEKTCKWPIGDPLHDSFHFCGNDSGESGPYCTYHARLAFQPPAERRRNR
ncbi:MAG: GcrA family cell cycle regulator [Rhizobiaceae bacterium]